MSNDPDVLLNVPEEDKSSVALDFELGSDSITHALGMKWNAKSDEFIVSVEIKERPCPRRGLLSMVAQIYDPLGYLQPYVLRPRLLLQKLCYEGYPWDQAIAGDVKDDWTLWQIDQHKLNGLTFNRCYRPSDFKPVYTQLHCFCDASTYAYGCCAYVRFISRDGAVHVTLVLGQLSRCTKKDHYCSTT